MTLLAGVGNTFAASSTSLLQQHQMQLNQRFQQCSGGVQFHVCAGGNVQHSGRNDDHNAELDLNMNDLAIGSLLAIFAPDAPSTQQMPPIEDLHLLPDMGRMTR
jgi:hypothetical protein